MHDNLQNLSGPWTFFGEHGRPSFEDGDGDNEQIEALIGLDEEIARDLPGEESAPIDAKLYFTCLSEIFALIFYLSLSPSFFFFSIAM